jgi:hypothetical protein
MTGQRLTDVVSDPIGPDELALRFTFIKLRPGQAPRFDAIWEGALAYAHRLVELCPPSAELSDAIKALEIVVYQANAAVARRYAA